MVLELSPEADKDLEVIFDYTIQNYGIDQAVSYVSAFDKTFETITQYPEMGKIRDEIKEGLRSMIKDNHVIFYRLLRGKVRIVRILHSSRDVPKQFKS